MIEFQSLRNQLPCSISFQTFDHVIDSFEFRLTQILPPAQIGYELLNLIDALLCCPIAMHHSRLDVRQFVEHLLDPLQAIFIIVLV